MEDKTKRCYKCKNILNISDFCRNRSKKDNLSTECRACKQIYDKYIRKRDPIKRKISDKKYEVKNKEIIKKRLHEYRKNNKERVTYLNKRWKRINKKRASELNKISYLKCQKIISDGFVKRRLIAEGVYTDNKLIIDTKRQLLKIKRLIKEKQDGSR